MILKNNSKIIIILDKRIVQVINEFLNNSNKWRRLDNEYYIELSYIENQINTKELDINIRDKGDDLDHKEKIENLQLEMRKIILDQSELATINLDKEYLKVNEFNLYWKNNLILGEFRNGINFVPTQFGRTRFSTVIN